MEEAKMNKKGNLWLGSFIVALFILVVFLALVPLINPGINFATESLGCSTDYTVICLIVDLALPIMAVTLLSYIIGILNRKKQR